MSPGSPERPRGARSFMASCTKPQSAVHGVRTRPGATALTLTDGPVTLASSRVRWLRAALDTAYGTELPVGRRPATDVMLTTLPSPLALRWGMARRMRRKVPSRLTSRMRRKTSSVTASRSAWAMTWVTPALLTSTSRRPKRSTVVAISRSASSASDTSAWTYTPLASDPATASPASTDDDELTTTCAPSASKARAAASPMPLDEPVTMTTLPSKRPTAAILSRGRWVQDRSVTVSQHRDRGRRGEHGRVPPLRPVPSGPIARGRPRDQAVVEHQGGDSGVARRHERSRGQAGPRPGVVALTAPIDPGFVQHPVHRIGAEPVPERGLPRVEPADVVTVPAQGAGTVAGGEGDGLVPEEQGSPAPRLPHRSHPALVLQHAGDPAPHLPGAGDPAR